MSNDNDSTRPAPDHNAIDDELFKNGATLPRWADSLSCHMWQSGADEYRTMITVLTMMTMMMILLAMIDIGNNNDDDKQLSSWQW